jgi:hypothetical protein
MFSMKKISLNLKCIKNNQLMALEVLIKKIQGSKAQEEI